MLIIQNMARDVWNYLSISVKNRHKDFRFLNYKQNRNKCFGISKLYECN